MNKTLEKIQTHFLYWREAYLHFPIFVVLTVAAIYGVNALTGRPILDSPEVIIGYLYNAVAILIAATLTGMLQNSLFGYRSKYENPRLRDDVYDAIITIFLFLTTLYCLWH